MDDSKGKRAVTGSRTPATEAGKRLVSKAVGAETSQTRAEKALIAASARIMGSPPAGEDMAFTHSVLCQVGLPRSEVDGREFMRRSGAVWLNVQAGYLDEGSGPVAQPIPYGALPRLAMAWVSTFAVRNKAQEIPLGDSAADFLRLMGMDDQGNRYTALRKQMHALAACRMQFGFQGRTLNSQPVKQFDAWLATGNQRPLWPGVMVLSTDYYQSLQESAVPLDNRALHALKGSALALDIYTWLAHRLHRIEGRPIILHWKSLREQFAQEYTGQNADKDFKRAFLPALHKVKAVYPAAKVDPVKGGILMMPSPPPIPSKGSFDHHLQRLRGGGRPAK
ncbi:replication protein RepA [Stenotrophomonas acidaminiphila]|uniref:replication protein RepA n=1 Tax=Stenotrophomonas acidaminiphila TaxID=128780 RepID=UPI0015F857A3|nr:replication protein RepA [Stenotrophomonas acidaminiphila]